MRANCTLTEWKINGGGILKNPFIRPGRSIKDPINETYQITFDLCTEVDDGNGNMIEVVNTSSTIHVNKNSRDAIIEINEENIPLIGHLQSGGAFVLEDIKDFGQPSYQELENWFQDSFGLLEFVESPLEFYAKIWTLHQLKFHEIKANGYFEFQ